MNISCFLRGWSSSPGWCLVVGLDGLEPSTSRLSGARSSHLSYRPLFHSWAYWFIHRADSWFPDIDSILLSTLAVKNGIRTYFSSYAWDIGFGRPSATLFFKPEPKALSWKMVEMMGFEPMTPCLQGRCSPNWATPPYLNGNLSQTSFNRSLTTEQQTQSVLSEYTSLSGFCLIRLRDLKNVLRS